MQLTQFTDYSFRMLIYIASRNGEVCTISDVADSYSISKSHLTKVAHHLGQLGIVKTIRGKRGGLRLQASPDSINLGRLVQQLEPNFTIVECFDKANGRCVIAPVCRLKHVLHEAKDSFIQTLEQYTLSDILLNRQQLSELLA